MRIALRQQPIALEQLFKVCARVQACKAVLAQPWWQACARPLGIPQAIAGIAVIADVVSDFARRVAHRLDDSFIPEEGSIRSIVTDQNPGRLTLLERVLDALTCLLVPVGALQNAEVGSKKSTDRISAHLSEGGIGVYHRVIG